MWTHQGGRMATEDRQRPRRVPENERVPVVMDNVQVSTWTCELTLER